MRLGRGNSVNREVAILYMSAERCTVRLVRHIEIWCVDAGDFLCVVLAASPPFHGTKGVVEICFCQKFSRT
jgi:hypothetical protein